MFNYNQQETTTPPNDPVFLSLWVPLAAWAGAAFLLNDWLNAHRMARMTYFATPPVLYLLLFLIPRARSHSVYREFGKAWFSTVGLYVLLVSAGAVLLLLASSAVGYLPYSDRPGPGWGNIPRHLPSLDEIRYFTECAVLMLPMCYFFGSLLFIFVVWMRWLKAPALFIRIAAGIFCAVSSMFAVAAAGWYIAIAISITNIVGLLGLLFGALVVRRTPLARQRELSLPVRAAGIGVACLAMVAILVYPFVR